MRILGVFFFFCVAAVCFIVALSKINSASSAGWVLGEAEYRTKMRDDFIARADTVLAANAGDRVRREAVIALLDSAVALADTRADWSSVEDSLSLAHSFRVNEIEIHKLRNRRHRQYLPELVEIVAERKEVEALRAEVISMLAVKLTSDNYTAVRERWMSATAELDAKALRYGIKNPPAREIPTLFWVILSELALPVLLIVLGIIAVYLIIRIVP